jgi:hypothetical protein
MNKILEIFSTYCWANELDTRKINRNQTILVCKTVPRPIWAFSCGGHPQIPKLKSFSIFSQRLCALVCKQLHDLWRSPNERAKKRNNEVEWKILKQITRRKSLKCITGGTSYRQTEGHSFGDNLFSGSVRVMTWSVIEAHIVLCSVSLWFEWVNVQSACALNTRYIYYGQ